MAKGGPGVVIVASGGLPVTQVVGGGNASPFTVVTNGGFPVTLVDTLGIAVALYNLDGTEYSGFSLTALTLAWSTAASDNTPGFEVSGATLDVAPVGAQIEVQVSSDVGFTPPPADTELSAVSGNPTTVAVSPALANAQYWARARLLDSGDTPLTDWSNVVTETINATRQFAAFGIYINSAQTRSFAANGNYIVENAA